MVFTKNWHTDYLAIMDLIDALSEQANIQINVRDDDLYRLMNRIEVPCKKGSSFKDVNVFKKAATFLCEFVNGGKGIIESIKDDNKALPTDITDIINYESAFIGFYIVCVLLKGATVDTNKVIENSIELSWHSHADIINALNNITLSTNFRMVAVLLEQLIYKTNPDLQYDTNPIG